MMPFKFMTRCVLSLLVLTVAGCGTSEDRWSKDRPEVHRVSGTVMLDGDPIEGANVNFVPDAGTTAAYALTDDEGRFQLSTFGQSDGAPSGKYKVTIRKTIQESKPNPQGSDYPPIIVRENAIVPEKYNDPATSALTAEVPEGGTSELRFELKR